MRSLELGTDAQSDLIDRAMRDPAFRDALVKQPKTTLEQALGVSLSSTMRVTVHQESADELHLVLPAASGEAQPFSDDELEAVAGQVMCTSCNGSCAPSSKD
jgi:hypothetical protein